MRLHGLLDDDMNVVTRNPAGSLVFNFSSVDQLWDSVRAAGARPIVELSFMPQALASCSWNGAVDPWTGAQNTSQALGLKNCSETMHYGGITQQPTDWAEWYATVRALAAHAVERYGLEEVVEHWRFEVWNELWGMNFPDPYMTLFNHSSAAVKSVDARIRVGGPATMQLDYVTDFVKEATRAGIPFDFVSTHMYPNDGDARGDARARAAARADALPPSLPSGMCPPNQGNLNCFPDLVRRAKAKVEQLKANTTFSKLISEGVVADAACADSTFSAHRVQCHVLRPQANSGVGGLRLPCDSDARGYARTSELVDVQYVGTH